MESTTAQNTSVKLIAHAKCIIAGEHAVMRNCPAIITPIPSKFISLQYEPMDCAFELKCDAPFEEVFLTLFHGTLTKALKKLNKSQNDLRGILKIENNIPMGGGIGFSSALCVAMTRWLIEINWLGENQLFEFAHQLENIFHKKSSGADIAGAMAHHIIHFEKKSHLLKEIILAWQPKLYISYSGHSKLTVSAIDQVTHYRKDNLQLAKLIDRAMAESVRLIEEGLQQNEKEGLQKLVAGINLAHHCFSEWQLISQALQAHMKELSQLGAIAAKPTGGGLGGYVLSLWDKKPEGKEIEFIPLFK